MPLRRFSSWRLLGIPGGFRMHSLLLTKPCLCCSRSSCLQGLEAFAFFGGDHDPRSSLPLSQVALCLGQGPPFVSASHLNDKDAFVGRTWWHRALRGCAPLPPPLPPAGCGGPGERQRFLCVPMSGSSGTGGTAVSYECVPCISQVRNFRVEASPRLILAVSGVLSQP